jgi:hypothetical protein
VSILGAFCMDMQELIITGNKKINTYFIAHFFNAFQTSCRLSWQYSAKYGSFAAVRIEKMVHKINYNKKWKRLKQD